MEKIQMIIQKSLEKLESPIEFFLHLRGYNEILG